MQFQEKSQKKPKHFETVHHDLKSGAIGTRIENIDNE